MYHLLRHLFCKNSGLLGDIKTLSFSIDLDCFIPQLVRCYILNLKSNSLTLNGTVINQNYLFHMLKMISGYFYVIYLSYIRFSKSSFRESENKTTKQCK
jgi:hypothetical protein